MARYIGIIFLLIDIAVAMAFVHPDDDKITISGDSDSGIVLFGKWTVVVNQEIGFIGPHGKSERHPAQQSGNKYFYSIFHHPDYGNKNARR